MDPEKRRKLQAKLRKLIAEGDRLYNSLDDATDAQHARMVEVTQEVRQIGRELGVTLADGESFQRMKTTLNTPTEQPIERGDSFPNGEPAEQRGGPLLTRTWQELCQRTGQPCDMGQWDSPEEFLSTILSRVSDPRLNRRALGEGVLDSGGFLVPSELSAQIMNLALEDEIVRSRATVVPMQSSSARYPLFDSFDRSGGAVTGISATWTGEHATPSEQQPRVELVNLEAKKFMVLTRLSSELLEDVPQLANQLVTALGRAVGYHLDDAFLTNNGASAPQGVLSSGAVIVVDAEDGQSDGTVEHPNLVKMMARLAPGSWRNSIWVCHPTLLPELYHQAIEVGTGGSVTSPLTRDSSGSMALYGRPLIPSEKVPIKGVQGDLGLYDFSRYLIGMRSELRVSVDQSAAFSSDEVLLKLRLRLDGRPKDAKPQTPKAGDTLSPFVVLAGRPAA